MAQTEIQLHASFDTVRYANCWEDADILIEALDPKENVCVSIGSAGDNAFALLGAGASLVHVVEMNPAQLSCVALRKAAYQKLSYSEFLQLHGEHDASSQTRQHLFKKCQPLLSKNDQVFWQTNTRFFNEGFGQIGKFEDYFTLFRTRILPLIHSPHKISQLFSLVESKDLRSFYNKSWNNIRWRLLFKIFFSRAMMGKLGRDPAFFKYVQGSVADRILHRTHYALTD